MDAVTAYLYGTLENDIYMKILKGLKMPETLKSIPRDMCAIKLKRSLYGLKQSGPIYVDDINIIRAPEEIEKAANILKREFETKDLGTTKLCLGLQFEHLRNGTFIHQSDKAHPFSIPMVVRPLDPQKDPYRPQEEGEEVLGPELSYLSAIGALMYLANNTRPDIAF
ncbi:uncharacterized protein LOC118481012 [Helianthus annuus]|uniref:uncharacterized protein LOC118481012 n=1 Tax=Helianthus annuus TaxID=4232 RepID=UPI001652B82B|nr:uncharacterized protein LOC118481012 [Helianthus annuus]